MNLYLFSLHSAWLAAVVELGAATAIGLAAIWNNATGTGRQ